MKTPGVKLSPTMSDPAVDPDFTTPKSDRMAAIPTDALRSVLTCYIDDAETSSPGFARVLREVEYRLGVLERHRNLLRAAARDCIILQRGGRKPGEPYRINEHEFEVLKAAVEGKPTFECGAPAPVLSGGTPCQGQKGHGGMHLNDVARWPS